MPRKKYRTKQTVIEEQAAEIEALNQTIEEIASLNKQSIESKDRQIQSKERSISRHAQIIEDILHPSITITAWRESWVADYAPEILSSTELWVISDDGNTYKDLFNEAIKVKKSLMDFYRSQESEIRVTISLNDWPDENIFD